MQFIVWKYNSVLHVVLVFKGFLMYKGEQVEEKQWLHEGTEAAKQDDGKRPIRLQTRRAEA